MAYKNKSAKTANDKAYYLANREKIIARAVAWRKDNLEQRKVYEAAYKLENAARISTVASARYQANSIQIKARVAARAAIKSSEIRIYQAAYRADNSADLKAYRIAYYGANKGTISHKNAKYRAANIEKFKVYQSAWQKANTGRVNATSARRRAAKLHATPPWLTKDQLKQVASLYATAKRLEQQDGIKWHVDHIYPLQGKTVCGLHVPWNLQILTAAANKSKYNKLVHND